MSSTQQAAGPGTGIGTGHAATGLDRFDLQRFVQAQSAHYDEVLAELRAGLKRSHWSWYVLPQLRGLGSSPLSLRYALSGLEEAQAYLADPLLGSRLRECVTAINAHAGQRAVVDILGPLDAQKLHACATLFALVAGPGSVFHQALDLHFHGGAHPRSLALLGMLPLRQASP